MIGGRGESEEEHAEQAGNSEDYAESRGHADRFKGAVRDAQSYEIPVRAGLKKQVAVIGDVCQLIG